MCGICGIYGEPVEQGVLEKMTSAMSHRGPDGCGFFIKEGVAFGHRRLSIIDLDSGSQPMSNETGDIVLVFNGEIYNYIELRAVLAAKGHRFRTRSDTEIIIHAYEEWEDDCVRHLNGMFAFAIWDGNSDRLLLARDHLGIKPLYYFTRNQTLVFASEIKALLQFPDCPREVDIGSMGDLFTYRYVPSPKTLFNGIQKVPPGHLITASVRGLKVVRFWLWKPTINLVQKKADVIERYRQLLQDAVRLQLRSDVPVGLFLSSGIDSNAILAIMAQHLSGAIHTFTIGFEQGEGTNETDDAREMANKFGADHTDMIIGPHDYQRYYDNYLWDLEEPVGNETAAAFYFVSNIASKKVKVALTGQGADEPWAGYRRYLGVKMSQVYSKLPPALTVMLKRMVMFLPRNEWLKRGVTSLSEPEIVERFNKIYSFFSREMKEDLFKEWVKEALAETAPRRSTIADLQRDVERLDPLSQMLYIDTRANLPDDLLMVNDKTSMANSIEARVPYLDYRIVEFVESLPPNWKLNGLVGKYLHKKAVEMWLPKDVIYRKKKGFANPITQWLRMGMSGYVEECLLSADSAVTRYFNKDFIKTLLRLHMENREQYLRHIYLLISFELWHRTFMRP